ncbi:hypothetical protein HaLaN_27162 [Haematococcus lacustris]|uniref:Uncharacterized protein n=1 Tax=Haematococcus lacustris TaxID=44745 RepID=A0A6A0A7W3_HAELA|nr:hypothetical protein HaLaN_27162 [Haematococcus lacustris]
MATPTESRAIPTLSPAATKMRDWYTREGLQAPAQRGLSGERLSAPATPASLPMHPRHTTSYANF